MSPDLKDALIDVGIYLAGCLTGLLIGAAVSSL